MKFQRIQDLRTDADMSQKQLSEILHISQRSYSHYETGSRNIPVEMLYHNSIHRRMDFCTLRFCFCLNIHIKTTIIKGKITLCYISQRVCKRESGCVSCYGFLYFCLTGSCLFLICLPISECNRLLTEFLNFDLNPAILTAPGSQIVLRVEVLVLP